VEVVPRPDAVEDEAANVVADADDEASNDEEAGNNVDPNGTEVEAANVVAGLRPLRCPERFSLFFLLAVPCPIEDSSCGSAIVEQSLCDPTSSEPTATSTF